MQSTAQIQTQQAQRLAKRLANHWKHKFTIEEKDQQFLIHFPSAELMLVPQTEHLLVTIQSSDESTDFDKLENVVLDHLIRMGQEDLTADWQR